MTATAPAPAGQPSVAHGPTVYVLGVDPGSLAGFCCLEVSTAGGALVRPVICGLATAHLGHDALANWHTLSGILLELTATPRARRQASTLVPGGLEIPFIGRDGGKGQDPILQGRHVGQIEAAAARLGIKLRPIAPTTAKKSLTGHGRAGVTKTPGDTRASMRKRGKAAMVTAARRMPGWSSCSLSIPAEMAHLEAAADAVGIALAALAKFREDLMLQRAGGAR